MAPHMRVGPGNTSMMNGPGMTQVHLQDLCAPDALPGIDAGRSPAAARQAPGDARLLSEGFNALGNLEIIHVYGISDTKLIQIRENHIISLTKYIHHCSPKKNTNLFKYPAPCDLP